MKRNDFLKVVGLTFLAPYVVGKEFNTNEPVFTKMKDGSYFLKPGEYDCYGSIHSYLPEGKQTIFVTDSKFNVHYLKKGERAFIDSKFLTNESDFSYCFIDFTKISSKNVTVVNYGKS